MVGGDHLRIETGPFQCWDGPMSFEEFHRAACGRTGEPPDGLSPALQALWHDARGDWDRAHACAQADPGRAGAWVHAYLHRKEEDLGNAAYWYQRANQPLATGPLADEWAQIARAQLA
jgi:hypothetical protein